MEETKGSKEKGIFVKSKKMIKSVISDAKNWMNDESGFQVFEKFGLTQGGVLLAIGVTAVCVVVMNDFWSGVGSRYFGSSTGIDALLDPSAAGAVGWGASADTGW